MIGLHAHEIDALIGVAPTVAERMIKRLDGGVSSFRIIR